MQFNNLKISTRLIMGFGALVGMVALVSLLGMLVARSTSNSINTIYNNRLVPIALLKQVNDNYMSVVLDASNKVSLGLLEPPKAIEQVKEGVAPKPLKRGRPMQKAQLRRREENRRRRQRHDGQGTPTIQDFSERWQKNDMYKILLLMRESGRNHRSHRTAQWTSSSIYQLSEVKARTWRSEPALRRGVSLFAVIVLVFLVGG